MEIQTSHTAEERRKRILERMDMVKTFFEDGDISGALTTLGGVKEEYIKIKEDTAVDPAEKINIETAEKNADQQIAASKKAFKEDEAMHKLLAGKTVSIEQLISLVNYFSIDPENDKWLSERLSFKRLVYKKKGYKILKFRSKDDQGQIQLDGFVHVQSLEKEIDKGWIPVDEKTIERILAKETAQEMNNIEKGMTETPQKLIGLIQNLRDQKIQPEMIKKKILDTKPKIKMGEHTANINYYMEINNHPVIHIEGFPASVWLKLEERAIGTAVSILHLLEPLSGKLGNIKPFGAHTIEEAMDLRDHDIKELSFWKEKEPENNITIEEINALIFMKKGRGVVRNKKPAKPE
ncbi:hypothetical protein HQ545_02725 [Candidatus Woesearchaeota archaeon]|nr:hypothetical protein [Candidatus Woesearchaeota archaeon]